jgi:hypothetical protein
VDKGIQKEKKFQLWGWTIFLLSAMFFIGASLKTGDVLGLLGGLFFLLACLVFMIPLVTGKSTRQG